MMAIITAFSFLLFFLSFILTTMSTANLCVFVAAFISPSKSPIPSKIAILSASHQLEKSRFVAFRPKLFAARRTIRQDSDADQDRFFNSDNDEDDATESLLEYDDVGEYDEEDNGNPSREDEDEEEEIQMYEEEADYDEIEEEYYNEEDEDNSIDDGEEESQEEERDDLDLNQQILPTPSDIWSTYDAIYEEPPVPLINYDSDIDISENESTTIHDNNYQRLQNLAQHTVLQEVSQRKALAERETKVPRNINSIESLTKLMNYIENDLTDDERHRLQQDPDILEVERITKEKQILLSMEDIQDILIQNGTTITFNTSMVTELDEINAFPSHLNSEHGENLVYPSNPSLTQKDLTELDHQLKAYTAAREGLIHPSYFDDNTDKNFSYPNIANMDIESDWPRLSNHTQEEILNLIEQSPTLASPEPERWLLYDLHFNVTNLILASFQHNVEAPLLFTQWMPQLEYYERYADQREKNFQWTWDDVEAADLQELVQYYRGIGYDSIPLKEPHEIGIINLDESPMDDEEREMMALENWYDEVYNEESDNLLFDDENFEPRDNVFDPEYGSVSSDSKAAALEEKFLKEFEAFEREFSEETQEWRDQFATVERFEIGEDPEGQEAFRGHLVIACSSFEEDLQLAEKITERFRREFGKAVFVETRVLGHARREDNVYEIWLESYEIDLLHSKRQAFINPNQWTGPSDVDEKQLDYLVYRVRDAISDESRYSYRMNDFAELKI